LALLKKCPYGTVQLAGPDGALIDVTQDHADHGVCKVQDMRPLLLSLINPPSSSAGFQPPPSAHFYFATNAKAHRSIF
jgi:hypothetical protein